MPGIIGEEQRNHPQHAGHRIQPANHEQAAKADNFFRRRRASAVHLAGDNGADHVLTRVGRPHRDDLLAEIAPKQLAERFHLLRRIAGAGQHIDNV